MNLNPVIVIPTYWSSKRSGARKSVIYDHMTPIDKNGELPRCLDSLSRLPQAPRVLLLVVSESGVGTQACEKVKAIAAHFNRLNTLVIGESELGHVHRRFDQLNISALKKCASLSGYGSVRNLGILAASILGHDTIIFLDDDEVITEADFIERALYGIGSKTPNGTHLTAKTGFWVDETGRYTVEPDTRWYRKQWNADKAFNEHMQSLMKGSRLSRAQHAYGGCMVLHADAFGAVAFDPWIPRGEDLDYVLSLQMYGKDIWFDNGLRVKHMPPQTQNDGIERFRQDMTRWFYENRKIEFAKAQIDLLQIDSKQYLPYPGQWLTKHISSKALRTCLFSIIGDPAHFSYWNVATKGRKLASEYARNNCSHYFELQRQWPALVRSVWNYSPLAAQLTSGTRR